MENKKDWIKMDFDYSDLIPDEEKRKKYIQTYFASAPEINKTNYFKSMIIKKVK